MQLGAQDAATRMAVEGRTIANRAVSGNFINKGLSQVSDIMQGQQRDKMRMESLQGLLPNFIVDPTSGRIKYKPN